MRDLCEVKNKSKRRATIKALTKQYAKDTKQ